MKVKIAYTVDLEDVEIEVQELTIRALSSLDEAVTSTQFVCDNLDTQKVSIANLIEKLDQTRAQLLKADTVLNDCQTILLGYNDILNKAEEAQDE